MLPHNRGTDVSQVMSPPGTTLIVSVKRLTSAIFRPLNHSPVFSQSCHNTAHVSISR
jgi:hypothetical protein